MRRGSVSQEGKVVWREVQTWKADFVRVPSAKLASSVSAPPNVFRIRAVAD